MHCEISSKLAITTPEWHQLCGFGVFTVNCMFRTFSNVSIIDFEQVNLCSVACMFKLMMLHQEMIKAIKVNFQSLLTAFLPI